MKVHIAQVTIFPTENVRPGRDVVPLYTAFLFSLQRASQHLDIQPNISESTFVEIPYWGICYSLCHLLTTLGSRKGQNLIILKTLYKIAGNVF